MSGEITINYNGTNYLVTLNSDAANFRIFSTAGNAIAVDSSTAAHLFGAAQAYSTLGRLYTVAGVAQMPTYWDNVLQSDAKILGWVEGSNVLSNLSGLVLGGLITGGTSLGEQALSAFSSATKDLAPSLIDIALTAAAVQDANTLLSKATGEYGSIQAQVSQGKAVSYDDIQTAINNTLISLYTGDAASQAASNIPGVQGDPLDDVIGFIGNVIGTFTGAVNQVGGIFSQVQSNLIDNAKDTADLVDKLGESQDQANFIESLIATLEADTARYAPLTAAGLDQSVASLQGNPSVSTNSHVPIFVISPGSPILNENAGTVTFTITRTDTSQSQTVYVSTVQDQGVTNPNNQYYTGILNQPVTFASGAPTAQVQLNIHDLGLTSGAEAFRLIVQQNPSDPFTTSLASDTFVISNTDAPPASNYSISPNAGSVNESVGSLAFTVARTNASQAATIYVSTVHDQGFDNPSGDYYYDGLLNLPVTFAAGQSTAQVKLTVNDLGLSSGSETFRLIAQQNPTDPVNTSLASANFTIVNNDTGIVADATVNEPVNTTFLLQPFLSLPSNGKSISVVNFINTESGPGQLTFGGSPTSSNVAVSYADIGKVGFATGSVTGSDKIEMYATYSDGTKSNVVDLNVNIQQSSSPPPPPLNSSGPVVSTNVQPLDVTVGQARAFSSANLDATDAAYPDPSEISYTITSAPLDGEFLLSGQFARSFTQADINAGRVIYQSAIQANLTTQITDTFTYVVSDPSFNQASATTASIEIDPLPPPPQTEQPYVDANYFPTVLEGSQIFLLDRPSTFAGDLHVTDPNPNFPPIYQTGSAKDQAIIYTIVTSPVHGQLIWFTNANQDATHQFGQPVTTFSQSDLNNGWVVYKNSFTSGASDSFTFTVADGFGGTIGPTTATIPVQPVDPVVLDIDAGVFVTTGGQSIITPDWLRVDDNAPNAYPNGFATFQVVQAPSHGTILVSGQTATTFTQLDIDRGLVTYQQTGGASAGDQFTLAVEADAYGNSISDLIVPVTIAASAVDRNTGAVVGIGQSTVISDSNLDTFDPGMRSGGADADSPSSLKFTITALSQHGSLSVNGTTLQLGGSFSQADLDSGSLVYTEDGSNAVSDSFGFSISDISFHNNYGSGTLNISIVNTDGGRIFTGASSSDIFYSGPGNNWVDGGADTTVSYSQAPASVSVDLSLGTAANGFGGTDTLSNIHSVIGSVQDDTFIAESNADDTFVGNGGSDTVVFSGAMANYTIASNNTGLVVSNGSITDTLTGITNLKFADGVSSYDTQGSHIAQTINNASGSSWVDTYDPENTSNSLWSTSSYDANGNLLSQTTTNDDGTHSLTMYDVNNSYNWSNVTINFDAQWNQTSVSGTNDDGSHTTTPKGLASAYDTALWFATPFDPNWNSTAPVTLTGDAKNDFLVGNAGNDMLVAGTGNDILYGNGGSNTFAFGPGSGQDKIMDFQTDQDVIQFNPALFANYAAVMQDTTQVGANTVIQHDANTSVTLENTLASNLTANNFHFS